MCNNTHDIIIRVVEIGIKKMSFNISYLNTWIASDTHRIFKTHHINYITGECTTGLTPEATVEYLHNNLRSLTGATDKPTRFAAVFLSFSVSDDLVEASREWTTHSIDVCPGTNCVCSKNIAHQFFLRNTVNGNILLIGNTCIKKLPFSEDLKKTIAKQYAIKQKLQKGIEYRKCFRCSDRIIHPSLPDKYCVSCIGLVRRQEISQPVQINTNIIITQTVSPGFRPDIVQIARQEQFEAREYARSVERQYYEDQFDLTPEYKAKLALYLEDRKKPISERIYV